MTKDGYQFESETDSEVIAHLLHQHLQSSGDLLAAMHGAIKELDGAYAIAAIHINDKSRIIVATMILLLSLMCMAAMA